MNIIKFLFLQSWRLALTASASGMIGGLSAAALVTVIADGVSGHGSRLTLALMFFGLCISSVIFRSGSSIALIYLSQAATLHLRVNLSRKFLATPHEKIRAIGRPECLAILTHDIMTFTQAFQHIPLVFSDAILIVVCMGYMAWLSWQLFLMFLVALVISMLAYHFAERTPLRKMRKLRHQMDILFKNFSNLIDGSRELQLNAKRGDWFVEKVVASDARQFSQMYIDAMTGYTWISNIGAIMFFLVIGMVLFVIPLWLSLSTELLTKFTLILLYLIGPITALTTRLPIFSQAGVSLKKIQQLDGQLGAANQARLTHNPFASSAPLRLQLDNVCHHYQGDTQDSRFLLGPLNLTIQQGEIVFIVGGNGSGKTTLGMLLLGFYAPESGTITLNGTALTPDNLDAYRSHFSAVFADFHLFEHLLGDESEAISASATQYLEKLRMAHKVTVEQGKFSTINLSTGQRKRLALVSSYLEDRAVYLFDEWAADQDPVFKRVFYTELLPDLKARGKTVLIITHDDAYFPCADHVVKLEDGQIKHSVLQVGEGSGLNK